MKHIQVDELENLEPIKGTKKIKYVQVIPNFMIMLVVLLLLTNIVTGFALYAHKSLITEYWRAKIHAMTEVPVAKAEEKKIVEEIVPTATPSSSPRVIDVSSTKGGCDLTTSELHEGICYPKAGY